MASETSKTDLAWTGRTVSFDDFAADLDRRMRKAGSLPIPHNAGNRRTESKQTLLQALSELGAKW